jgi:hypothetical protein
VRAHVAVAKKSRRKPAVKAPTWEEEVRPQLPKRMTSSTYDFDFEPPVVGLPPAEHDASLIPLPEATPIPAAGEKVKKLKASRPAQVARKFEHVALVMAAILAVLLGLAIGTVLARTGGNDAATPATVTQSAAATQPAG